MRFGIEIKSGLGEGSVGVGQGYQNKDRPILDCEKAPTHFEHASAE